MSGFSLSLSEIDSIWILSIFEIFIGRENANPDDDVAHDLASGFEAAMADAAIRQTNKITFINEFPVSSGR